MKSHANITVLAAIAALTLITLTTRAGDGVWNPTDGSSWNNAANWIPQAIPGGIGSVITNPVVGTGTTLDYPFTVGKLVVDVNGWTEIHSGSGGSLTFDNGSEMPEFQLYPGGNNRLSVHAPIHGTKGLLVCTKAGNSPFLQLYNAGSLSGDLILSNNIVCQMLDKDAFGTAKTIVAGTQLRVNSGITFANEIVFAGGSISSTDYTGVGQPVYLTGGITLTGAGGINSGTSDGTPILHINCPITGNHPNNKLDFRGSWPGWNPQTPQIYLNGPVSIDGSGNAWNSDTVVLHMGTILYVNAPFSWQGGRFNFWGGSIICGAADVFDNANAVWFNTWNENLSQIFDLNGHDQRVGGIYGGANHPDHLLTYSRITSASPATFTLDVPNGGNCVMENRSYFDGELTVVKTGEGKQILNTTFADNMIRKWIVEDGELIPRWGVYSADIEVRGGWIWVESGYNPTFRFRLDGTEPDKIVVKDGGGLDISRVNIEFVGMPDKHGEYLILDASESGASLMYDDASPTAPFHSVTGLPEDCRLKMSRDKKQVRLIRGDLGTFLIIK